MAKQFRPAAKVAAGAPTTREQAAVAWTGLVFVLVGLAGWYFLPQAKIVWIVLLVFGVATVPQAAIWWIGERRR